jgi:hypothetical protein
MQKRPGLIACNWPSFGTGTSHSVERCQSGGLLDRSLAENDDKPVGSAAVRLVTVD